MRRHRLRCSPRPDVYGSLSQLLFFPAASNLIPPRQGLAQEAGDQDTILSGHSLMVKEETATHVRESDRVLIQALQRGRQEGDRQATRAEDAGALVAG